MDVPFLGEVPLNIQMRIRGDEGRVGGCHDDESCREPLEQLSTNLVKNLVAKRRQKPPMPSLSVIN